MATAIAEKAAVRPEKTAAWMASALSHRVGLAVVLTVYVLLYGTMLVATDFVPYVLDNNESFSSLNHARNLIEFGAAESFGLADEAVSPEADAHPFVHTHQGNLPRLFSSLLYLFGARSIELQIAITTFTIGLAVVAMAFTFFARRANPLFALIAALVLMTDYVFFAQWQVNTYRVWIPFFIFSSLLCAEGLTGPRYKRWILLTYINSAFLFYYEFVFVAFGALTTGFYIGWRLRRDWRRLLAGWTALGLGAVTGLGVLTAQLIGYLGWQDFLTDAKLTFFARNMAEDPTAAMRLLRDFYGARNIAFFYNLMNGEMFDSWRAFRASFTRQQFEILTPFITVMTFVVLAGAALRSVRTRLARRLDARDVPPTMASLASLSLLGAAFAFLGELLLNASVIGLASGVSGESAMVAVPAIVLTALAGLGVSVLVLRLPPPTMAEAVARLSAAAFLLAITLWISAQPGFYRVDREILWGDALVPPGGAWLDRLAVFAAATAWVMAILLPRSRTRTRSLDGLLPFFVCGLLAYGIVYRLSPGYIHTGYLYRGETFLVAHLDAAVAAALFLLVEVAREFAARRRVLGPTLAASEYVRFGRRLLGGTMAAASLAAVLTGAQWLYAQGRYVQLLPPNQLAFLARLKEPPFKGKGIVSNTYAIPFASTSGSWGYMDPFGLSTGGYRQTADGYEPALDFRYLWLADREVNPAYRRPEVFVCFYAPNLGFVAARLADRATSRCDELGLVKAALSDEWRPFRHRVVAMDRSAANNWALLALDWTTAPYLKPLADGPNPLYVRSDLATLENGGPGVVVDYLYGQQDGDAESGTVLRLYRVAVARGTCRVDAATALTPMSETRADRRRAPIAIPLPRDFAGTIVASVTPASTARRGREYFGPIIEVGAGEARCPGG